MSPSYTSDPFWISPLCRKRNAWQLEIMEIRFDYNSSSRLSILIHFFSHLKCWKLVQLATRSCILVWRFKRSFICDHETNHQIRSIFQTWSCSLKLYDIFLRLNPEILLLMKTAEPQSKWWLRTVIKDKNVSFYIIA